MVTVVWTELHCPGDVISARPSPDGAVTAAGTAGGHLYLGRHTATSWVWERAGFPPGGGRVRDAVPLGVDASGAVTVAVVGDDLQVWLYQSQGAAQPWTSLGGPPVDPAGPQHGEGGVVVASTASHNGSPQHTLVMTDLALRPWMRQGVDPDGTWFPIALDDKLTVWNLATAMASVAPGADPQLHIIALVQSEDTSDFGLRIAVRENAVWTWHDPASTEARHEFSSALSATSIRDGSGQLQVAVLATVSASDTSLSLFTGSGNNWSRTELGHPAAPSSIGAAVLAVKGPDPQARAGPVVIARAGHHIWTRSPATDWTDRGTTPGDVAVVSPEAALDQAGAGLWAVGVSWEFDLWTFALDSSAISWEGHGYPGALAAVAGAYNDTPEEGLTEIPVAVFAVDGNGALWQCRTWSDSVNPPFAINAEWWTCHDVPTAGVTCAAAIGVLGRASSLPPPDGSPLEPAWVFTAGSDGHLWARTAAPAGWIWVDHGAPAGRAVKSGTGPVAVTTPAAGVAVPVLADDGRVWMRAGASAGPGPGAAADWTWTDRGVPPGQLIFAIIGAAVVSPSSLVVAVITSDGHVWASVPAGAGFSWTDLGAPGPAEKIVAGIGLRVPAGAAGSVDVAGLGAPSGQIWTARWAPGSAAPQWTPRGRPADARILGAVGTLPDPASGGTLVAVVGNDQQVWVTSTASTAPAWTRWDPAFSTTTVTSGRTAVLLNGLNCAIVLDQTKRAVIVSPPPS
jgi:hypothetical protein